MISLKKILVPSDFSDHSAKAVRYGEELAAKFSAELHLLHVTDPTVVLYGEGGGYFSPETAAELAAAATKQLNAVELHASEDVAVTRLVVQGYPFLEIIRYAKEKQVDLIVLGTHGRGAVAHMLLGSVAEKVARKAPCPVLVVREEEHDFVMP